MQNMTMKTEGSKLIITVDLAQDLGPSKSGKTTLIATTGGNKSVPGAKTATFVGLNVYKARV